MNELNKNWLNDWVEIVHEVHKDDLEAWKYDEYNAQRILNYLLGGMCFDQISENVTQMTLRGRKYLITKEEINGKMESVNNTRQYEIDILRRVWQVQHGKKLRLSPQFAKGLERAINITHFGAPSHITPDDCRI